MKKEKKEKKEVYLVKVLTLVLIGFLIQFFVNDIYGVGVFYSSILALLSIGFLYYYWGKSFFHFLLFFLVGVGTFISLEVSFNLDALTIFICALVVSLIFGVIYSEFESRRNYALLLLCAFVLFFIILGFNVKYRDAWMIENYLTIPFVILLFIASKWFKFSKISYSMIFAFMFLHVVGSHYTYSEVPFGYWLQSFFDLERNNYDRLVHFSFGLLMAYPVREVFVRIGNYKGVWALFAPIVFILGMSSVYELIEWGAVLVAGGDLGVAYLGTQGDIWDAQKDMFLAGVGSIFAMLATFLIIISHGGKIYWTEIKDSFKVKGGELGEFALQKMKKK